MSHHTPDDQGDRYSYDNLSYDRHYDDYSDRRSEEYDHYDDQGPLPSLRDSGRGIMGMMPPGYYTPPYRPPSYAASWDSYGKFKKLTFMISESVARRLTVHRRSRYHFFMLNLNGRLGPALDPSHVRLPVEPTLFEFSKMAHGNALGESSLKR